MMLTGVTADTHSMVQPCRCYYQAKQFKITGSRQKWDAQKSPRLHVWTEEVAPLFPRQDAEQVFFMEMPEFLSKLTVVVLLDKLFDAGTP